jgi:Stress responsive A/B Barrel Domain
MFRHVVLFTWKQDATREQQQALAAELRKLPAAIDVLRAYHVGPDAGVNTGNYDFAVVADFDDVDGYLVYRDHPAHQAVIEQYVQPIVASRAAVQYEI